MKNLLLNLFSGQISSLKVKINQAIGQVVAGLSDPKNVEIIEQKKDEIISKAIGLLPVQVRILYNIPFVKTMIDKETNDAVEFLIRSFKNADFQLK